MKDRITEGGGTLPCWALTFDAPLWGLCEIKVPKQNNPYNAVETPEPFHNQFPYLAFTFAAAAAASWSSSVLARVDQVEGRVMLFGIPVYFFACLADAVAIAR